MNTTATHITVKGKVQGVFFRKYTRQKAIELSVHGWVKNTKEGNVEIFAQGSSDTIQKFINWCWQGSPKAHVENVETKAGTPDTGLAGFSIHY